jgi:sugar phosphate isomerase/epimerase
MSRVVKKERKTMPTLALTDEITLQVKDGILKGLEIATIAESIGFPANTVYSWIYRNTQGLGDKVDLWKMERTLELAERVGRDILTMVVVNSNGTRSAPLTAIQQRESEYVRDALVIARKKWSKKDAVNINIQLPQPILDLGKLVATIEPQKTLDI